MLTISSLIDANKNSQMIVNFTVGETIAIPVTILTGAQGTTPLNLTGATVKMTIAAKPSPIILSSAGGNPQISVPSPSTGAFVANMTSAVTAAVTPGTYLFDIWVEPSTGVAYQYCTGQMTFAKSISSVP